MKKNALHIRNLCMTSLFAAVIAIMAQIAIPMPFGVPLTMQTFGVIMAGIILGAKNGAAAALIYVLLGATGLPVFANFTGGWQSIIGPTGGFILSFPLMAYLVGLGTENRSKWKGSSLSAAALGTILNLTLGTAQFCLVTSSTIMIGITTCILPFLLVSIIKAILAHALGLQIRRRLQAFL